MLVFKWMHQRLSLWSILWEQAGKVTSSILCACIVSIESCLTFTDCAAFCWVWFFFFFIPLLDSDGKTLLKSWLPGTVGRKDDGSVGQRWEDKDHLDSSLLIQFSPSLIALERYCCLWTLTCVQQLYNTLQPLLSFHATPENAIFGINWKFWQAGQSCEENELFLKPSN